MTGKADAPSLYSFYNQARDLSKLKDLGRKDLDKVLALMKKAYDCNRNNETLRLEIESLIKMMESVDDQIRGDLLNGRDDC